MQHHFYIVIVLVSLPLRCVGPNSIKAGLRGRMLKLLPFAQHLFELEDIVDHPVGMD